MPASCPTRTMVHRRNSPRSPPHRSHGFCPCVLLTKFHQAAAKWAREQAKRKVAGVSGVGSHAHNKVGYWCSLRQCFHALPVASKGNSANILKPVFVFGSVGPSLHKLILHVALNAQLQPAELPALPALPQPEKLLHNPFRQRMFRDMLS